MRTIMNFSSPADYPVRDFRQGGSSCNSRELKSERLLCQRRDAHLEQVSINIEFGPDRVTEQGNIFLVVDYTKIKAANGCCSMCFIVMIVVKETHLGVVESHCRLCACQRSYLRAVLIMTRTLDRSYHRL